MKKISFVLIISVLLTACVKEKRISNKTNDLFKEFDSQQGFAIMNLPPILFKVIFKSNQEDPSSREELLDKIEMIKVLIFSENDKSMKLVELNNRLNEKINEANYKLLTQIKDEGSQISIYVKDEKQLVREIIIQIMSDNDLFCVNCIGEFSKEDALKLYNSINTNSLKTTNN